MIETVAEGLVLAEKAELGKENLHKFIEAISLVRMHCIRDG